MKLYLDEHLSPLLATILLERGIDCLTVRDAGLLGGSDEAQLIYGAHPSVGGGRAHACGPHRLKIDNGSRVATTVVAYGRTA